MDSSSQVNHRYVHFSPWVTTSSCVMLSCLSGLPQWSPNCPHYSSVCPPSPWSTCWWFPSMQRRSANPLSGLTWATGSPLWNSSGTPVPLSLQGSAPPHPYFRWALPPWAHRHLSTFALVMSLISSWLGCPPHSDLRLKFWSEAYPEKSLTYLTLSTCHLGLSSIMPTFLEGDFPR